MRKRADSDTTLQTPRGTILPAGTKLAFPPPPHTSPTAVASIAPAHNAVNPSARHDRESGGSSAANPGDGGDARHRGHPHYRSGDESGDL